MAATTPSVERAGNGVRSSAALNFLKASPKKLLIGGKWVPAKSGKTFETLNPATEEVLALIAEGDKADVDEAVKAARKAFEEGPWSKMGPHERARYLFKIADLIEQNADELAELETLDNGKAKTQARAIDIAGSAETFRYYGGWCTKIYGETNPSDPVDVQLHAARTGRRVRTDYSVELSATDGVVEARPGARLRQHRRF